MSWQPTKPQAGDAKNISQGDVQGNFLALNNIYNGINNFIILPEQAASPATAINQMALFTKAVGGVSAMFLRNENSGASVDFTTALKADPGWCQLPCGIQIFWGNVAVGNFPAGNPVVFPAGGFSNICLSVTATNTMPFGNRYYVQVNTFTATDFLCRVSDSGGTAIIGNISYIAIGY